MSNKTSKSEPAAVPLSPDEIDAVGGAMMPDRTSGNVGGGLGKASTWANGGTVVLINSQTPIGSVDGPIRLPF